MTESSVSTATSIPVILETFIRAGTDRMFRDVTKQVAGLNRLYYFRKVTPLGSQTVIRMNKDTLYSMGVVDTSKGATVTFPENPAGHYASVSIAPGHCRPLELLDSAYPALSRWASAIHLLIVSYTTKRNEHDEKK